MADWDGAYRPSRIFCQFYAVGNVPVTVEILPKVRDIYIGGYKATLTPNATTTTVEAGITGWVSQS